MNTPARLLANRKLRITVSRLAVLELLQAHARLAPMDIFRLLDGDGRRTSLATVHRVLAELCDAELAERHFLGDGKASFSPKHGDATVHLVCKRCGTVQAVADAAIERRVQALAAQNAFAMQELTVSLRGVCMRCAAHRPVRKR